MRQLSILLCFLFLSYVLCKSVRHKYKHTVKTLNGVVAGTEERTKVENKVYYAFKGVPFAKPPIGKLRFEPPQPPDNWTRILQATKQKDACLQMVSSASISLGSEDCLYLNIYTPIAPREVVRKQPLTVMVWIYGGGYIGGDTSYELYAPDFFLNENVVFVAVAYRLGIFGFFSTGDLVAPGNNGLRDQIRGLTWIKQNIQSFGGDPNEITIFGQSAGGASISFLTQTPLTKGLYKRAIMQSGVSILNWALSNPAPEVAYYTAQLLGINATSSETLKRKLREVNSKELCSMSNLAEIRMVGDSPLIGLPYGPVIEPQHPGAVVLKPPLETLRSGETNPTPMLIGFNSLEVGGLPYSIGTDYLEKSNFSSAALVPSLFGITNLTELEQVGDLLKVYYFSSQSDTNSQLLKYVSDLEFVINILETAQLLWKQVNVFLYELSYLGELGNPTRSSDSGVGHGEDLNYLFWRLTNPVILDPNDVKVRTRMVHLWANFAKTGNPTPTKEPVLQNITWPMVDQNLTFLNIKANLQVENHPRESDYKFWMDLFQKFRKY